MGESEKHGEGVDLPLQTYVKEVCLQILRGVVEAQSDEKLGKFVGRAPVNADYKDEGRNSISIIDFDISAEVSFGADGTGGISVAKFIKLDGKAEHKRAEANRISFSVPVAIPSPEDQIQLRQDIAEEEAQARRRSTDAMNRANSNRKRGY